MRPIPTEYMGTKFRSKGEAKFARLLDLMWKLNGAFIYEPQKFKTSDGWIPDFLVDGRRLGIGLLVYEYKPSDVSVSYLETWCGRCREINTTCDDLSEGISHLMFCASLFRSDRNVIEYRWESYLGEPARTSFEVPLRHFEDIQAYRFDLKAGVA